MIALTTGQAAGMAGAMLDGDGDRGVTSVTNDTRSLAPGALFVALRGSRDGHEFLDAAMARGAAAALVESDATVPSGLTALRCRDPRRALGTLGAAVRERLDATVVAVTGSTGKTCTKDFTAAVLEPRYRVAASQASFNNEIGVPLTVLSADEQTQCIVAEVGSRGIGHIAALESVLRPDIAVITNVGTAHLGMFGSVEAIARAKGELVEMLGDDGCAVLNADDEHVAAMASRTTAAVITFGTGEPATVRATGITLDRQARARFTLITPEGSAVVTLPVSGEHMVWNALAAAAVAHRLSVDAATIATALADARTAAHRMRVLNAGGGWTVVDDSYNASPAAVVAALKALMVMGRLRRTWAVLGHMAELGEASDAEHDRIGRLAVRLGVGRVVTVGEEARAIHEAARLEGMSPDEAIFVADAESAAKTILAAVQPGDVVLVKGSRVAGLERVVEAIA